MDISNLKKKYPFLIDHLQSSGYDKSYIECIRFFIKDVLKHASELVSYQDYLDSVRPKYKPATYERKVSAINMIELFEKYGVLPALNSKVNFWKQHKYESLSDDYRSVIDTYREVAISRRICKTSIEGFVLTGINFFVYLQSCGSTTLDDIQEEDVLNYFYDSPSETIIRGYDLLYKIKRILKASQTKHVMEVIEDRHARRATIIASQLPVSEWYEVLEANTTAADAILDRIVHTAVRFTLSGASMRKI